MCSCQDCQGKRRNLAIPRLVAVIVAAMCFILLRALLDPQCQGVVSFGARVLTGRSGEAWERHEPTGDMGLRFSAAESEACCCSNARETLYPVLP